MLRRYGTSCFLQLQDEDVPPAVDNRIEATKGERERRLELAATQKKEFLSTLARECQTTSMDHSYAGTPDSSKCSILQDKVALVQQQHLIDKLYYNHIWLSPDSL